MKDLFKSKGFTAGFIVLALLILLLGAVLVYLLSGRGANLPDIITMNPDERTAVDTVSDTEPVTSESAEETTPSEETEPEDIAEDKQFRALTADENHLYPVLNEMVQENGTLSVHRPEGLIFHTKPQFDRLDENNNTIVNDGDFPVNGKIFIVTNSGSAAMMYHTENGYYTTSDPDLISFSASQATVAPDRYKVGTYGASDGKGLIVQIFSEDGSHLSFSIYNENEGTLTPALENVIAQYDAEGLGHFEFRNTDGRKYEGTIEIRQTDGVYRTAIQLGTVCTFDAGATDTMVLNHD